MIASLFTLLLAAQASGPPAPPPGRAAPVTVTAPAPDPVQLRRTADEMQEMYDQTCSAREWGAYDDMCNGIRTQVKEARATADRAAREAARSRRASAGPN